MKIFTQGKKEKELNKVVAVHIGYIKPNPYQPRKSFSQKELSALAKSISTEGVIQPLTVRKEGENCYILVTGERRLRAARIAGLKTVPCIILNITDRSSALFALVENLQRCDLNIFEEAEGISKLIDFYGMTQEDAAIRLGMAQSTVANKLRLLKLSEEEREVILSLGLSERHARALLRIPDYKLRLEVLEQIARGNLSVEKTELLIDTLLSKRQKEGNIRKNSAVLKNVRLFMNTVSKAVEIMQAAGVDVKTRKFETDGEIQLVINIPRDAGSEQSA